MELPNGVYRARAMRGQLGESANGKERVVVEFELLDDAYASQRINWYGYFTDKSLEISVRALRACGWYGDDLSDLAGLEANEVELVVENEAYEGKVTPKVKWVNVPGAVTLGAPMQVDKAKAFAARLRQQVRAIDASEGRRTSSAQRGFPKGDPRPEPPLNDDIPF